MPRTEHGSDSDRNDRFRKMRSKSKEKPARCENASHSFSMPSLSSSRKTAHASHRARLGFRSERSIQEDEIQIEGETGQMRERFALLLNAFTVLVAQDRTCLAPSTARIPIGTIDSGR